MAIHAGIQGEERRADIPGYNWTSKSTTTHIIADQDRETETEKLPG